MCHRLVIHTHEQLVYCDWNAPHWFALLINKNPYNQQEWTNYSLDPTKTEYMLLSRRGLLTGPKRAIKMGDDYVIEEIVSTRCLGV